MADITRDPTLGCAVPFDQGKTLRAVCRAHPVAIEQLKAGKI